MSDPVYSREGATRLQQEIYRLIAHECDKRIAGPIAVALVYDCDAETWRAARGKVGDIALDEHEELHAFVVYPESSGLDMLDDVQDAMIEMCNAFEMSTPAQRRAER